MTFGASKQRIEATESTKVPHEDVERFAEIEMREPEATARATAHTSRTKAVIPRPLIGIAKDFVRLGSFLELFLGSTIAVVTVGMVLHREPPVGFLDVSLGGVTAYAEHFVVIAGHENGWDALP